MRFMRWGSEAGTARLLRAARPEAPEHLVRRLAASSAPAHARARSPRFALAGVATATMLIGVAAVGGASYAANTVVHLARIATGHTDDFGRKLTVAVDTSSAANDQYGGEQTSNKTETAAGGPGSGSLTAGDQSSTTAPVVTVAWTPGTFTQPVVVLLDPAPPAVQNSTLLGVGNQVVSVIVTDSSGKTPLHQLAAPLQVQFKNPPKGFVPVVSTDGVNFRALTLVPGPDLPANLDDGYFVAPNGDVIVLTRHLTLFAVLYKANINVSESGRKTPTAGSGAFGDPTRNHNGAPVVQQVGDTIQPIQYDSRALVPFTFHVDEQAAVFISIYDANGNPLWIQRSDTFVRGHRYDGAPVHTFHVVVLRPGQIKTLLGLRPGTLKAGATYKVRITAVDFDGHKVTSYTTFTS